MIPHYDCDSSSLGTSLGQGKAMAVPPCCGESVRYENGEATKRKQEAPGIPAGCARRWASGGTQDSMR